MTQMVVNARDRIIHIETGYPSGNNDKGIFNQSTIITKNLTYGEYLLLANGGYPGIGPLVIPFTDAQAGNNYLLHRYNEIQRAKRVIVDQLNSSDVFGRVKGKYRALHTKWRHQRSILPLVVRVAAGLYNRGLALLGDEEQ
jgi:hypothetical protein